ncbi:MAG: RecX family transcriptional regulator [Candidatus Gracilibacteria bacterium]|nr:RecX family transcriptional regulator [Candidatus Gracilibacteria bacterium]
MKYTKETLKNYSLWYYFKYFPSTKKLLSKLIEKSKDEKLSNEILKDISHLIDENRVIKDKINIYLIRNKNLNYIRQKLILAGFEKNLISEILQNDFLEEDKSLLNKNSVFVKVSNYKNAGKSISYIKQKLIERDEDIELVNQVIDETFAENGEEENIKKEYEKLKNKYDKNKIIQKLIAKGFRYDEVKKVVS